jgi:hypothetical protein
LRDGAERGGRERVRGREEEQKEKRVRVRVRREREREREREISFCRTYEGDEAAGRQSMRHTPQKPHTISLRAAEAVEGQHLTLKRVSPFVLLSLLVLSKLWKVHRVA